MSAHTVYSFDSIMAGVTVGPRDMYRFAQGESLALPPFAPGLVQQKTIGANPLKLGFVGASNTHNATATKRPQHSG